MKHFVTRETWHAWNYANYHSLLTSVHRLHNVKTKLIKSSAQQKERFFKLKWNLCKLHL